MSFWNCFSCFQFSSNNNINNIIKLDYCNCTLNDIPSDVFKNDRTIEELLLSSNRISLMPSELFYCNNLKILKLNDNELGIIPATIGMLRNLQQIDFSRNVISSIPDNIKLCKNLTYLDLSLNNLQRLPDALTNLITLKELYLNETYLDFLPADIGRLINLKILEIRSNNLITLPKSIGKLISLNRIDIGGNEFTELPEEIGQLTQLRELWIDYNRIRRISGNISNLSHLIHFEGNNNQLTTLPNEISNWKNLEILSMSSNNLEYLPFSIGMLKNLITLKCDGNHLKEIPDSICNLNNLEELIINNNYILRLPNTIGILNKLIFLAIDENLIRRLPNELCNCKGLKILSASNNKLIELPNNIGNLKNLYVINIINNIIINLPVSILNLTKLQALWICDNQSQPLVPLQYLDDINKTQLTCFMLPQQKSQLNNTEELLNKTINQQINLNELNELNNYNDINLTKRNCVQQRLTNLTDNNVISPSRRICFADELITNQTNKQKNQNSVNSTTTTTTTVVTSAGLMRSPTPYPKELRLMAKYVRNQQNQNNKTFDKGNIEQEKLQQINNESLKSATEHQQFNEYLTDNNNDNNQTMNNDLNINETRLILNPNNIIHNENQYQLSNELSPSTTPTGDIPNICDTINKQKLLTEKYIYDKYGNSIVTNLHKNLHNQTLVNDNIDNCNNDVIYDTNMLKSLSSSTVQHITTTIPIDNCTTNNLQSQDNSSRQYLDKISDNFINYNNLNENVNNSNMYHQHYDIVSLSQLSAISQTSLSAIPNHNNNQNQNYQYQEYSPLYKKENIINTGDDCDGNSSIGVSEYITNERGQPPPYHIAKNFTKKSREDLLNYDTIRNQSEYINNCDSININSNNSNEILCNNKLPIEQINNDKFIISINDCYSKVVPNSNLNNFTIDNNINNSSNLYNNNSSNQNDGIIMHKRENRLDNDFNIISYLNDTIPAYTVDDQKINNTNNNLYLINNTNIVEHNNIDCNNEIINNSINNINSNIKDDYIISSTMSKLTNNDNKTEDCNLTLNEYDEKSVTYKHPTNQWLFGLHKNPTVKQVIVKKDPTLGFEIKQDQHQGTFVSITLPNTSASSLLRINDKILDVDGFDFTKIPLEEAKKVLMECGPTLNIMISRK